MIVLGRTADWLLGTHLGLRDDSSIAYHQITHPSPLGLMGMAKRAGKGVRVSAMKEQAEGFPSDATKPAQPAACRPRLSRVLEPCTHRLEFRLRPSRHAAAHGARRSTPPNVCGMRSRCC